MHFSARFRPEETRESVLPGCSPNSKGCERVCMCLCVEMYISLWDGIHLDADMHTPQLMRIEARSQSRECYSSGGIPQSFFETEFLIGP